MSRQKKRGACKTPEAIDHASFLQMLNNEFPEVAQAFDQYGKGLLHIEMGVFARLTEEAMDDGRFWQVEQYFRFIERVRDDATPELKNAVDVSYIEFLALSEVTDNRRQAIRRMPHSLLAILVRIDGPGRWVL